MKPKDKPLSPGNNIAKRILLLLNQRFGNERLYKICVDLEFNQGGFRNSLESPQAFNHAVRLDKIAKYFNVSLQWLMYGDEASENISMKLSTASELEKQNLKLLNEIAELKNFIKQHL